MDFLWCFKRKGQNGDWPWCSSQIRTRSPIPSEKRRGVGGGSCLWLTFRAPVSLNVPSRQTTHKLQQITTVSSSEAVIHCFTQGKWLKIATYFTLQGHSQTSASHHGFTGLFWKANVPCILFGSPSLAKFIRLILAETLVRLSSLVL